MLIDGCKALIVEPKKPLPVPKLENTDIVRTRYMALGGHFVLIVKQGCGHHPHGLKDPTPIVNFITAYCAHSKAARKASSVVLKAGTVTELAQGQW